MSVFLWIMVLVAAALAAHWGADKIAEPLKKLRQMWGLSEAAGAAFVALATASPEVGTNIVSAAQGLKDIGLGNLLGSNIISVPAIVTVAYIASRKGSRNGSSSNRRRRRDRAMRVKPEALYVQALPYLAIIALAALLTVPKPWRGLQPIDGWIMFIAYFIYLAQAILRQRQNGESVEWTKKEVIAATLGIVTLGLGAYFTVTATENIVSALGISEIIGGLFITSTMSIAPEVFATWSVAKSGQVTSATTNVIADNTVTMTLAFVPLALVGLPIDNMLLFTVNLSFVALLGAVYALLIYQGTEKYSFELWEVATLIGVYLLYLIIMIFWVLPLL
ncbi:MAG: sodium:calcium exchanger [Scytonema sp. PMC 1069.18]|nr:sodium:calcium exchanger [Scytonema sp. PMC 1069.18]MEC4885353.1 sodium:calcium exchanger [Scytonema sp. PMC 1070.18]